MLSDETIPEEYLAKIPPAIIHALLNYEQHGRECGHFVMACLRNDLANAVVRADADSLSAIREIVLLIYNFMPAPCWGSKENVDNWIRHHGLDGQVAICPMRSKSYFDGGEE